MTSATLDHPGYPLAAHSANLIGEGMSMTRVRATHQMQAVLFLNASGHTANEHTLSGITFDASGLANFSVLAPATTRSTFSKLAFVNARVSGLYLGYGWVNVIDRCTFNSNGLASLHLDNNINAVQVLNSRFEGSNQGVGILVNGGAAVLLEGNCIEGCGGPAVIANGVRGLTVRSNYYEANNRLATLRYVDAATQREVSVCTDLLLDGAPLATAVSSLPNVSLAAAAPCSAVSVVGNYHNPYKDVDCAAYAGVYAFAADGLIVEANTAGVSGTCKAAGKTCSALVTGPTVANESYRVAFNTGAFR